MATPVPTLREERPPLPRRMIVWLMVAAFVLPFPLGLVALGLPSEIRETVAGAPVIGEVQAPVPPLAALWTGAFQRAIATGFAKRLFPRSYVVRLTNQLYYDLFGKSHMYHGNILVGAGEVLYEKAYVEAYCRAVAGGYGRLEPTIAKLAALHRALEKIGRPMVLVVTPSKAATQPDWLPPGICRAPADPDAGLRSFVTRLRAAGVPLVDGATAARAMMAADPLPPFPRGGTHWSRLTAMRVAGEVVAALGRSAGRDFGAVGVGPIRWDAPPAGSDTDFSDLLNLFRPPLDYPTGAADADCRTTPDGEATTLVAVGGSFTEALLRTLADCRLFGRIDYYFYFETLLGDFPEIAPRGIDRRSVDLKAVLGDRSALLVELNEVTLSEPGRLPWLGPFLDAALRAFDVPPPR